MLSLQAIYTHIPELYFASELDGLIDIISDRTSQ